MANQTQEALLREADAHYDHAELDAALKLYRRVLDEDETVAWAHSRVGAIRAQMGDIEGAEQALLRAIELNPTLPQAHSNLGNIYYARGDYEAALAKYKEAVALAPSVPVFHENLHAAYKRLGKLTEAVTALKQAHRLDRQQVRDERKAKFAQVKQRVTARGRGCLGTTAIFFGIMFIFILGIVVL